MPVREEKQTGEGAFPETLYQREQYEKGGVGRWYWDLRDGEIIAAVPDRAATILDAGCGEGITLEKLCRRFPDKKVSGIDLLDENLAICGNHGLPVSKGDLAKLDLQAGSIDCCILAEVIEHLDRPEGVLRELWRIMKTGGRLIVVYPNDAAFKFARLATLKIKEAKYDPGHVRQWTPRMMKKALEQCGFDVEKTKSVPFLFWAISLHGIIVAVKQ
jgi:2-polyprenyl-3-methyl-5-hydroxy-6-metoxy-1,4-benzoquinol methylase